MDEIRPRKYSIDHREEEERILIFPSTETIPDEYTHYNNHQGLVVILHSSSDIPAKNVIIQALTDQEYHIRENCIFPLSNRDQLLLSLNELCLEDHNESTCLILIVVGTGRDGEFFPDDINSKMISVSDIWTPFVTSRIFNNKPKIFIFQAYEPREVTVADAVCLFEPPAPKGAYQVPVEADILLVYQQEQRNSSVKFIEEFCCNMDQLGRKEDIISLITHSENEYNHRRPLLISTLTKKFYVSSSERRGHQFDINQHHLRIFESIEYIHDKVENLYQAYQNKKEAKRSNSFKRFGRYCFSKLKPKQENMQIFRGKRKEKCSLGGNCPVCKSHVDSTDEESS